MVRVLSANECIISGINICYEENVSGVKKM